MAYRDYARIPLIACSSGTSSFSRLPGSSALPLYSCGSVVWASWSSSSVSTWACRRCATASTMSVPNAAGRLKAPPQASLPARGKQAHSLSSARTMELLPAHTGAHWLESGGRAGAAATRRPPRPHRCRLPPSWRRDAVRLRCLNRVRLRLPPPRLRPQRGATYALRGPAVPPPHCQSQ